MDQHRFDLLTRSLSGGSSRRTLLRGLAALGLGTAIARDSGFATARKKRKKPCGPCQRKKKGRCRGAKPNDTRCGECGVCADGVCVPSQIGCPACQECVGDGRCCTVADNTPCSDADKCLNGTCNPPPTCERPGTECNVEVDPECCDACCSGSCRPIFGVGTFCRQGFAGAPCFENDDCAAELTCIGYRCA